MLYVVLRLVPFFMTRGGSREFGKMNKKCKPQQGKLIMDYHTLTQLVQNHCHIPLI